MLSVDMPPLATVAILGRDAETLNGLLSHIRTEVDLVDATDADIGERSDASELYAKLRAYKGMGRATVSKLLARKRPRLLPVRDSRISDLLRLDVEYWKPLHDLLCENDRALHTRLLELRDRVGIGDDISAIRVWDIVCWMQASHPEQ